MALAEQLIDTLYDRVSIKSFDVGGIGSYAFVTAVFEFQ
jgi:hypothetical protein